MSALPPGSAGTRRPCDSCVTFDRVAGVRRGSGDGRSGCDVMEPSHRRGIFATHGTQGGAHIGRLQGGCVITPIVPRVEVAVTGSLHLAAPLRRRRMLDDAVVR